MYLSDFDLKQLHKRDLTKLSETEKDQLLVKLLRDLMVAREGLKATSQTSSRPPSSDPPWSSQEVPGERAEAELEPEAGLEEDTETPPASEECDEAASATPGGQENTPKKPGRPKGMPGYSRQVQLPLSGAYSHPPEHCVVCGQPLEAGAFIARTGLYMLEVEAEQESRLRGLRVRHDKHLYGEIRCRCGHLNRSEPGRCAKEPMWEVALTEWHLVGPMLASLIVCLSQRMRLSRRRIQEFLRDWLGIELSTSTLNQCIHEAGRAVEPLEEQLVEELQEAYLAHADETPWKEWGHLVWLWVITTPTVCLYFVGYRSQEILANVFGEGFVGWLMSDGYQVYRQFKHRLRCWAHLLRKAKGLEESLTPQARAFGSASHSLLKELMAAVYRAREGPPVNLQEPFAERLAAFRKLCEQHRDSTHEKTRALAREFLNDWEAIWCVLAHPYLPLTNNEAERALRHWVILRRISQGTRTEQGSRVFALLASVIDTCRKRHLLPWPYLAQVIAERRKGHPAPPLPAAA